MPKSRGRAGAKRRPRSSSKPRPGAMTKLANQSDDTTLLLAALNARAPSGGNQRDQMARTTGARAAVPSPGLLDEPELGQRRPDQGVPTSGRRLQVTSFACEPLKDATPQSLGVTYWFDPAPTGEPYPLNIRLIGRRLGDGETPVGDPTANQEGRTSFDMVRTVQGIVPGSGRTCVTTRIPGLAPGEWEVAASTADDGSESVASPIRSTTYAAVTARAMTAYTPVVNVLAPGARLGAWPALVGSGALVALLTQWFLAARTGLPAGQLLAISLIACLFGLVGAKAYYLISHRAEKPPLLTAGMCIQGFVIAAIGVIVIGVATAGIPLYAALDASVPGLLFGKAIGRLGCFLGGCCAGRPSASRWAIWSSDRTMGTRRIPVQIVESSMAAAVGIAAFVAVAWAHPHVAGAVFLAGIAADTVARQVLFPMRSTPRATAHGRTATLVGSGLALVVGITLIVM